MALFLFDLAFDLMRLDFNEPFRAPYSFSQPPARSLPLTLPAMKIGDTRVQVPAHQISFSTAAKITWGSGNAAILAGQGFAYDGRGQLTGGTVTMVAVDRGRKHQIAVIGVSAPAGKVMAVTSTASNADDIAMFRGFFKGSDLIGLSRQNDVISGGPGNDLIFDRGGADVILGAEGDDLVNAGPGNDNATGGKGDDIVLGDKGDDRLDGQEGDDVIWPGGGSDIVSGSAGRDVFVVGYGDGSVVITDFHPGTDLVAFAMSQTDLAKVKVQQVGADVQLSVGTVRVILQGLNAADLGSRDMSAGGEAVLTAALTRFFNGWDYLP